MRPVITQTTSVGRRYISITQPSIVLVPPTVGLSSEVDVQEIASTKLDSENPQFQALGSPATLLSLKLPASVPVYIRRNSLLSIYGIGNKNNGETSSMSSIRNQLELISPIKRLLYGNFTSSYQKLVSTIPFSLLVTANNRKSISNNSNFGKSFATIALDGTTDWGLFTNDSLQVYTGSSLSITNQLLPSKISKNLSKKLNVSRKVSTGLFKWTRAGYTLLTGRGYAGIVGNGQIYKLELAKDEEIIINKYNLLAMSINGTSDLSNCVVQETLANSRELGQIDEQVAKISEDEQIPESTVRKYWNSFKSNYLSINKLFSKSKTTAFNLITGNKDYIKVIGPRNILIQTNTNDISIPYSVGSLDIQDTPMPKNDTVEKDPQDYLSYVSVKNGKVEFESTPNFNKSIEHIESLKK